MKFTVQYLRRTLAGIEGRSAEAGFEAIALNLDGREHARLAASSAISRGERAFKAVSRALENDTKECRKREKVAKEVYDTWLRTATMSYGVAIAFRPLGR